MAHHPDPDAGLPSELASKAFKPATAFLALLSGYLLSTGLADSFGASSELTIMIGVVGAVLTAYAAVQYRTV